MKFKRNTTYIILVCILLFLSGCSYKEAEDSIKNKLSGLDNEVSSSETANIVEENNDSDNKNVFYNGDTIVWQDYYGQEIQYTLQDVETAYNINDLGIEKDDIGSLYQEFVLDSGNILNSDDKRQIIIAANIRVKNISFKSIDNGKSQDMINQLIIDNIAGRKSDINSEDGGYIKAAAYFSEHATDEKDYYMYTLEEGSEKIIRLAWILPEEAFQEPFYYIIGGGTGAANYQYIQLNQKEDKQIEK